MRTLSTPLRIAVCATAFATTLAGCTNGTSSGGNASASATPAAASTTLGASPAGTPVAPSVVQLRPMDRAALAALVKNGGNRACGHDIENEVRVPTSAEGDAIAAALPQATYFVRVGQNSAGSGALVIIEQHLVPSDANIAAMVAEMQRIAHAHHGTFDRWETQPVKSC